MYIVFSIVVKNGEQQMDTSSSRVNFVTLIRGTVRLSWKIDEL